MEMSTLDLVERLTFLSTLLVTVAPVPACYHMLKTGQSIGVPYTSFVIACVNSVCIVGYGYLINNPGFINMNLMGVVLNAVYAICYIYAARDKMSTLKYIIGGLAYVTFVYLYCTRVVSESQKTDSLGFINTVATIILLLSPLLEVPDFIREKSCAGMPLSMLVGGAICSIMWTIYGKMLNDPYIYLPNIPSFFTTIVYVILLMKYGQGDKHKEE